MKSPTYGMKRHYYKITQDAIYSGLCAGIDVYWNQQSGTADFGFWDAGTPVIIKSFFLLSGWYTEQCKSGWVTRIHISGSNDNVTWKVIAYFGDVAGFNVPFTFDCSHNNTAYRYYKTTAGNYYGNSYEDRLTVRNVSYSSPELFTEVTVLDDYDWYKDTPIYSGNITTERNYYKYTNVPWQQPLLSSADFSGKDQFECIVLPVRDASTENSYAAWYAFDGKTTSICLFNWYTNESFVFSNTYPLNVTNLHITNYGGDSWGTRAIQSGEIQASNDGETWQCICEFTNSVIAGLGEWDIDLSSNSGYYTHYRIVPKSSYVDGRGYGQSMIAKLDITATQKVPLKSTVSSYDFTRENQNAKILRSYEKGQYYGN